MKQEPLFDALGFRWDRVIIPATVPMYSLERVCFRPHKMLAGFVWDAAVLEGNPYSFIEIQTLMDGVSVGGRKLSDQDQVLNLIKSLQRLLRMTKSHQFSLTKPVFTELNGLVVCDESSEWGLFRGEGRGQHYTHNSSHLNAVFCEGVAALEAECLPFERALAFFLFGALQQFFFCGNKRTSLLMMNGILMSNGIDAISVPAEQAQVFNEKMAQFYRSKDATDMMMFLMACHPEAIASRLQQQAEIRHLRGKLHWEGNLDEMRTDK